MGHETGIFILHDPYLTFTKQKLMLGICKMVPVLNGVRDERVFSTNDFVTNDGRTTNESTSELVGNVDSGRDM